MSLSDLHHQIKIATFVTEKLEKNATATGGFSHLRRGICREFSEFKEVLENSKSRLQELEDMQRDLKELEKGRSRSPSRMARPRSNSTFLSPSSPFGMLDEYNYDGQQKENVTLTHITNKMQEADNRGLSALADYEHMTSVYSTEDDYSSATGVRSVNISSRDWDDALRSMDEEFLINEYDDGLRPKPLFSNSKRNRINMKHHGYRSPSPAKNEELRDDNRQTCTTAVSVQQGESREAPPIDTALAVRERSFRTNLQLRAHELATRERTMKVQSLKAAQSLSSVRSNRSVKFDDEEKEKETPEEGVNQVTKSSMNKQQHESSIILKSASYVERETISEFTERLQQSIRKLKVPEAIESPKASEEERQAIEDKPIIISAMKTVATSVPGHPHDTVKLRRGRTEPPLPTRRDRKEPPLPTMPPTQQQQPKRRSSTKTRKFGRTSHGSIKASKLGRNLSSGIARSIRLMTGKELPENETKGERPTMSEVSWKNEPSSRIDMDSAISRRSEEEIFLLECIERQELKAREGYIKAMQEHQALVRSGQLKEGSRESIFYQKKLQAFFAKIEYWESMKVDFQVNPSCLARNCRNAIIETLSTDRDEDKTVVNEKTVEVEEEEARETYIQAVQHHRTLISSGVKADSPEWIESEKQQQNCLAELQRCEKQKIDAMDESAPETKERKAREAYIKSMKFHQSLVNSNVEPGSQAWVESEKNQRECLARLQYWETLNVSKARSSEDEYDDTGGLAYDATEMRTVYFDTPKTAEKAKEVPTKTLLDSFTKLLPGVFGDTALRKPTSRKQKNLWRKQSNYEDSYNGSLVGQSNTDLASVYSDDSTGGLKGLCFESLYSCVSPGIMRVCCSVSQLYTAPNESNSCEYDANKTVERCRTPGKTRQKKYETSLTPGNPFKGKNETGTGFPATIYETGNECDLGYADDAKRGSTTTRNPAVYAIEYEAREILGHLSHDYASTRGGESFGLTPKASEGGFWRGDTGGPKDLSLLDAKKAVAELAPTTSPKKDAGILQVQMVMKREETKDEYDGDDESGISYALDQGDPTFFCGLERL